MPKNHYRTLHSSLLRHYNLVAGKLALQGIQCKVVNLDAITDDESWPEGHMIGLAEFTVDIDEFYRGAAVFALGLTGDTNLMKSAELIEAILDDFSPGESFMAINPTTGIEVGRIVVTSGVRVAPPLKTRTRPLIPIYWSFTSNLTP